MYSCDVTWRGIAVFLANSVGALERMRIQHLVVVGVEMGVEMGVEVGVEMGV